MNMKSVPILIILFLALLPAGSTALAGQAPPAAIADQAAPDPDLQGRIIDWVCEKLNANYVYPDLAAKMEKHVHRQFKGGAYRKNISTADFLGALTRDLFSVCKDAHLRVSLNPNPPPPDSASDLEKEKARLEQLEKDRSENFYFRQCERLSGNVGYVRFDKFVDARYSGPTAVAAMNFLGNCDALIIDLRFNGGGSGTLIQLLLSYFFDKPVHYNNMYIRNRNVTEQNWTSAHVQGSKMTALDLYVLTSGYTFSAAEEFTYDLMNLGRATIVGARTGGGAHPVTFLYQRELHVELKVPHGRSFNPKTGLDWEGTGIEPDVKASREEALAVAHALALKNLYLKAPAEQKERRKWDWQYQEARARPFAVDAGMLRSYAGQYGPVRIAYANGGLVVFEPKQSQPQRLCPLSDTMFVIDGISHIRVQFEKDDSGAVIGLLSIMADGQQQRLAKSQ